MKNGVITYNNKTFRREVEMLGDVEMVKWFVYKPKQDHELWSTDTEIYDQDLLTELENLYEGSIIEELIPVLPII